MKTSILIGILACAGAACAAYAITKKRQAERAIENEEKTIDWGDLEDDDDTADENDDAETSDDTKKTDNTIEVPDVEIPDDIAHEILDSVRNIIKTATLKTERFRNITKSATKPAAETKKSDLTDEEHAVMDWINDPCNPFDETSAPDASSENAPKETAEPDNNTYSNDN